MAGPWIRRESEGPAFSSTRRRGHGSADHWSHADFTLVLDAGVRDGRLKKLGSNLYELAEPPAR